ncbi:MAG: class I SAM-dependent methyltransferase [Eubacterium sp.]|nr:class I SAM-dependent methyltransferase [Eubacterium sp.]
MSQYKFFASVYDRMMDNIPYDEWEQYLLQILYKYNVPPDAAITELGCGTGIMTRRLADYGFTMTGIDLSKDMLDIAIKAQAEVKTYGNNRNDSACPDIYGGSDIEYYQMDMRAFAVDEKQDAIISIADSMNYLLTNEDLYQTLKSVHRNLKKGGIFIFDLKTEYLYREYMDGRTFKENLGDFSYIWKNHYDEEKMIHSYYLRFKYMDPDNPGKKLKTEELHRQRVFKAGDIKEASLKAGFNKASVYGELSFEKPRIDSQRIYVVLKKES